MAHDSHREELEPALLFLARALPLAPVRPLWLDEILQLMDTRQPAAARLMARLPYQDPGSAPLGYLGQHAALKIVGYSVWRPAAGGIVSAGVRVPDGAIPNVRRAR
jgi:hypothetical protein